MKRLAIILLLITCTLEGQAQDLQKMKPISMKNSAPEFAGTPWGSPPDVVKERFGEAGYTFTEVYDSGDLVFDGKVLGEPVGIVARMRPGYGLAKVRVLFLVDEQDLFDVYDEMRGILLEKYGAPARTMEDYRSPYYKGDGYEEQAIRVGKATIATYWQFGEGPDYLSLMILESMIVEVGYEPAVWEIELDRRKKSATDAF